VKGVYERYNGWFSGEPVELLPLTPDERARKMVDVFGQDRQLTRTIRSRKLTCQQRISSRASLALLY